MPLKKINFRETQIKSLLINRRVLKTFLISLFERESYKIDVVDIIFCTDEFLLYLNKTFLNHDYYTDTLSFLLSSSHEPIRGEIYISIDRVKDNANLLNIPYKTELLRVIMHSCLHLCGYSDTSNKGSNKMQDLQERYLNEWFVSRETSIGG